MASLHKRVNELTLVARSSRHQARAALEFSLAFAFRQLVASTVDGPGLRCCSLPGAKDGPNHCIDGCDNSTAKCQCDHTVKLQSMCELLQSFGIVIPPCGLHTAITPVIHSPKSRLGATGASRRSTAKLDLALAPNNLSHRGSLTECTSWNTRSTFGNDNVALSGTERQLVRQVLRLRGLAVADDRTAGAHDRTAGALAHLRICSPKREPLARRKVQAAWRPSHMLKRQV